MGIAPQYELILLSMPISELQSYLCLADATESVKRLRLLASVQAGEKSIQYVLAPGEKFIAREGDIENRSALRNWVSRRRAGYRRPTG
jgi:hypothetical protein